MKYYYMLYWANYAMSGWRPMGVVCDKHPFVYMAENILPWAERSKIPEVELASWEEISEEEFQLYAKMEP